MTLEREYAVNECFDGRVLFSVLNRVFFLRAVNIKEESIQFRVDVESTKMKLLSFLSFCKVLHV